MKKRIMSNTLLIFFIILGFVQTTKYINNKNILHNERNINNNFVEKDNNLEVDIRKIMDILRYPGVSINNIRKEDLFWKGELNFFGDINTLKNYLLHLNNNKINIESYKIEKNDGIIGYLEIQFS